MFLLLALITAFIPKLHTSDQDGPEVLLSLPKLRTRFFTTGMPNLPFYFSIEFIAVTSVKNYLGFKGTIL